MVNEQTVYDHPSTSELTSRIYSFIFLRIPKGVYLSRIFLEFLSDLYPTMIANMFQIYGVKTTEK